MTKLSNKIPTTYNHSLKSLAVFLVKNSQQNFNKANVGMFLCCKWWLMVYEIKENTSHPHTSSTRTRFTRVLRTELPSSGEAEGTWDDLEGRKKAEKCN